MLIQSPEGKELGIHDVLMMFEGIIDFILNGLFGHSENVTNKIYTLLKAMLKIEKQMEDVVSRSLFESIKKNIAESSKKKGSESPKNNLNDSRSAKISKILDEMFELIHPLSFI